MHSLFEITKEDIALLGDTDLRELIGRLCEADYRSAGLPTSGILYGGHQDARDGGLDVFVGGEVSPSKTSYVPRSYTGFQVKKPDMIPSKIVEEMRPKGILRESISDLIKSNGAYIIVSRASSTYSALKARQAAMRKAVADAQGAKDLLLKFYDAGQIATWLRAYPLLILWVREKIGRPIQGWEPYGKWAYVPGNNDEPYLVDDKLRLIDGTKSNNAGCSIEEGLQRLRAELSTPGRAVRLAGLSGVGKTRFAQALFEPGVGEHPLDPSLAIYADMGATPDPAPCALADQLVAGATKACLIIDNCPPELHGKLSGICRSGQSALSLLTIEYDIRDDLPEETAVFRLETASPGLIEKLVRMRFTHISHVDTQSIAEFSGGNARIAIALGQTVQKGETLSSLRDGSKLFERLFRQRHSSNDALMRSAEVCSLVYSFEAADKMSADSELAFLASLINVSVQDLYRDLAELADRGLAQSRGVWKAVLPQAIADRLAKRALERMPKDDVATRFRNGPPRLLKSFSRRLGYLHDSPVAVQIAEEWLNETGWLGESIGNLNNFGMDILSLIAPASPEMALQAIERAARGVNGTDFATRNNPHHDRFVSLLLDIAYDADFFERCFNVLFRFALAEDNDESYNSSRRHLKSLFHPYLSGTLAAPQIRCRIVARLVSSGNHHDQKLGLLLLDAALEALHISSSRNLAFGARSRDYGYCPQGEDVSNWYRTFLDIALLAAMSKRGIALSARKLLGEKFRGIWLRAGIEDDLVRLALQLHRQSDWNEGWAAVRETIRYATEAMPRQSMDRLRNLEKKLRPTALLEKARAFLFCEAYAFDDEIDHDEGSPAGWEKAMGTTREIAMQVARSPKTFNVLLPELVSRKQSERLFVFGQGLAEGCANRKRMFNALRAQVEKTSCEDVTVKALVGYLSACSSIDRSFYESMLDRIRGDKVLGKWFPSFQASGAIGERGVERLREALTKEVADIGAFETIAYGRAHESIGDRDLAMLLRLIMKKPGGLRVAFSILNMRLHRKESETISKSIRTVARTALMKHTLGMPGGMVQALRDLQLSGIVNACLQGEEAGPFARKLCRRMADAVYKEHAPAYSLRHLMKSLAKVQPMTFLDSFLDHPSVDDYKLTRLFRSDFELSDNPVNRIPDETLLAWCAGNPSSRAGRIVSAIDVFSSAKASDEVCLAPVVKSILDQTANVTPVLGCIDEAILPTSWSGSRASIVEKRTEAIRQLSTHSRLDVRTWAKEKCEQLQETIRRERLEEERRSTARDHRFE